MLLVSCFYYVSKRIFKGPGITWLSNTCSVVIMEGDPHPGAVIGRMSFQSFNHSIDVSVMVECDLKTFPLTIFAVLISNRFLGRN